ncbi:MAG: flagellar basal body P-ring formation protein FlgA [Bacteroidetes bacterium]|nr:flagellar basal body P-ring formation protein FlgA [Bacteroidota bacterium]
MTFLLCILLLMSGDRATVTTEEVRSAVERYLHANLPSAAVVTTEIEYRSLPADLKVPAGPRTIRVAPKQGMQLKGRVGLPVEIVCGGKVHTTILCSVIIRTFEEVYVAVRPLGKNELLDQSLFILQRIETTEMDDAVTAGTSLLGLRTKRMLTERSALRHSAVETAPAVRRDQLVSMLVRSGTVTIGASGVAKEDGVLGALVQVQRLGSKETVQARVVGQQIVEIDVR